MLTLVMYKKSCTGERVPEIFKVERKCMFWWSGKKDKGGSVGVLVKENLAQAVVQIENNAKDNEDQDNDG